MQRVRGCSEPTCVCFSHVRGKFIRTWCGVYSSNRDVQESLANPVGKFGTVCPRVSG